MLIDPRHGDIEDDAASPGQRSLLAIAGSLLVEISLPKLLFAWTVLLLLPAVLLGLAPLLVSAWFSTLSEKLAALTGIGTALVLLAVAAIGWIGWRPLFRIAENNFWSLNALAVQPGYAFTREALRHLTERIWGRKLTAPGRARLRSGNSVGAGIVLSACAVLMAILAWPATRCIASPCRHWPMPFCWSRAIWRPHRWCGDLPMPACLNPSTSPISIPPHPTHGAGASRTSPTFT